MEIHFKSRPDLRKLMNVRNAWSTRSAWMPSMGEWSMPSFGHLSIPSYRFGRRAMPTPIMMCPASRIRTAFMSGISAGIGLGAISMYLMDPGKGARRRAILRDKSVRLAHRSQEALSVGVEDLRNRTRGVIYSARSRFAHEEVSDETLVARVRSRLGRVVANTHGIHVTAHDGTVNLSGPVRSRDLRRLLRAVGMVKGVRKVEHQLELHEHAENIPGLQGGNERMRRNWSPSARLLAGMTGGAALAFGATRRDTLGWGIGAAGFGLILRSAAGPGVSLRRELIQINKTINIKAPVADVYGYWSNFENFPLFMRYVRNVEDIGNGRSRWTVAGPAGVSITWDAEITHQVENEVIAWASLPKSIVRHTGAVRFSANPDGSTQVDIRISYQPPAGALGHVVASIFGRDPKHEMDQDVARMKTMIETGNAPHDAADPLLKDAQNSH